MKSSLVALAGALLAIALVAGAVGDAVAQDFLPYEGKNAVHEGEGGTKKIVNGIDFWADGAPPRSFKLLGYISDRRHKSGLIGMMRMSTLEGDVADVAKANGGDAVILVSAETDTVGTVGNSFGQANGTANTYGGHTTMQASGWSTGLSTAVQKQQSKYAVVKYVDAPTASNAPAAIPAAPQPTETAAEPAATATRPAD